MNNATHLKFAVVAGSITACAGSAFATQCDIYLFDKINPPQSNGAGQIKSINSSYWKDGTHFSWSTTLGKSPSGKQANGFWLAVSPGPNPKGKAGELALLYFDGSTSDPILTAYGYNGENGDTSWKDGNGSGASADKILTSKKGDTSWVKSLKRTVNPDGTVTMSFAIDPTKINGHTPKYPETTPYTGVKYGSQIGVWFHPVTGLTTDYNSDGFLKKWSWKEQGWYDDSNQKTQCVPEPGTFIALGVGAAAFLRRRGKK